MVGLIAFSLFIDFFLYGILLPLAARSPAGLKSEEQLAWLYGAYAISALLFTPLFGYLGDRAGGRSVVLCGLALAAFAAALFGFALGFPSLILARLCQGAGSAALWTGGLALIAARYIEKRVEMIGYAFTGSTAGSVLGPIAGGVLSHAGGYKLPFLITAGLLAITILLVLLILPPGRSARKERTAVRALLLNKSLATPALAVALAAFALGIIEPLLPLRLAHDGATPKVIGLIFTAATVIYGLSAPLVGRLSERLPINKVITIGAIAMAVTLPLLAAFKTAILVGLGVVLVYGSYALLLNPASAELGNVVDRAGLSCYSAAYAVYNIVYSIGMLASAALASAAPRFLGFLGALLCVSAISLACIPLFIPPRPAVSFEYERKNSL